MNIKLMFLMLLATLLTACKLEVYTKGEGTVSIDPSQQGKVCENSDADLCYEYTTSMDVTIHAAPSEGYHLSGWSLAQCGTSTSCTIPKQTTNQNYVLTATFDKDPNHGFKTTWKVGQSGTLKIVPNSSQLYNYNYSVYWGDGTKDENVSRIITKNFS